jgi:putative ABC transport system ATP-binding protein
MGYIQGLDLVKEYGSGQGTVRALAGVSLEIQAGEFAAVMGESGSGKSTLLSILGALLTPTSGRYVVDGIDVYALSPDRQADFRREYLGFVFQSFHLIPYLTALENVMLPLATASLGRAEQRAKAELALARVGLKDKGRRLPNQLSGGEQERTALARAIVNEPPLLLADEPTGNLDTRTSGEIMALFQALTAEGVTIVMVTHSPQCAAAAGRLISLSDGRLSPGPARAGGEAAGGAAFRG